MKKKPETETPSANKNTSSANDYNTDIQLLLAEADVGGSLPEPYCAGGSHHVLALCICEFVARYSPPYPHPKPSPDIQKMVQDSAGYSLQVIQAAIDFLTRAGIIIQRFNGNDVVLTIRAGF